MTTSAPDRIGPHRLNTESFVRENAEPFEPEVSVPEPRPLIHNRERLWSAHPLAHERSSFFASRDHGSFLHRVFRLRECPADAGYLCDRVNTV